MWAFAGPACMGDQPTAVWLASLLADNGPDEIVGAIGRSADSILRRYPEPSAPAGRRGCRVAGLARGLGSPGIARSPTSTSSRASSGQAMRAIEERLDPRRDKAKVFAAGVELPPIAPRRDRGSRAPSRRPPRTRTQGMSLAILIATFATLAVQHRRVGRRALIGSIPRDWLRHWRDRPPTGELDRASVAMTPFRGCGSAANPSPTGRDPSFIDYRGCAMIRAPGTCPPTRLRAWPRCRYGCA